MDIHLLLSLSPDLLLLSLALHRLPPKRNRNTTPSRTFSENSFEFFNTLPVT